MMEWRSCTAVPAEVPALASHYSGIYRKSSDTYDEVDAPDFNAGLAIVAVTTWTIANDPKPIVPRIHHTAVAENWKKTELDQASRHRRVGAINVECLTYVRGSFIECASYIE